jgi:hypothetical protein
MFLERKFRGFIIRGVIREEGINDNYYDIFGHGIQERFFSEKELFEFINKFIRTRNNKNKVKVIASTYRENARIFRKGFITSKYSHYRYNKARFWFSYKDKNKNRRKALPIAEIYVYNEFNRRKIDRIVKISKLIHKLEMKTKKLLEELQTEDYNKLVDQFLD